jgi:hypothetical protein
LKTRGLPINQIAATTDSESLAWLMFFSLGLVIDMVIGGQRGLGRLPSLDQVIAFLFAPLANRLDRSMRSAASLTARAILVQLVFLPLLYMAGALFNDLSLAPHIGAPLAALLIARTINFRSNWDAFRQTGRADAGNPAKVRSAIEALVLSLSRDWLGSLVLFVAGGFAVLLPYRFLAVASGQHEIQGAARPEKPFTRAFTPLFDLMALPGALWTGLLLALGPIFVPGTQLAAARGFFSLRFRGILSRLIVLTLVAYALNFSFAFGGGKKAGSQSWIGPSHGRAKLAAVDLRTFGKLMLAAGGIGLMTMTMFGLLIMV